MKAVRAIAAVVLLLALVGGVPFLLLSWGRLDALLMLDWRTVLTRPDDGQILLAILTAAGWLAWGLIALTTALETLAALTRHRVSLRLPGTGWFRPGIAALIAAATLAPATAMAAPSEPPPLSAEVTATETVAPGEKSAVSLPADPTGRPYTIQAGDELWDLAERELGAGERWREILAINSGLTAETRLAPGQRIMLPLVDDESTQTVTVERGDNLWIIAEEHLGDPQRWTEIHELNRDTVTDPDEIEAGWQLRLPAPHSVESAPDQLEQTAPDEDSPGLVPPGLPAPRPTAPDPAPSTSPPPSAPGENTSSPASASEQEDAGVGVLLGSMGAVLAAGLAGGLAGRRRIQALGRTIGQRIVPLGADLGRFWTALVRRAGDGRGPGASCAPTAWVAGWRPDGEEAFLDLEAQGATFVSGNDEHVQGLLGTAITSLLCAPWSEEVSVIVADAPDDWAGALDDPALTATTTRQALDELNATVVERRIGLGVRSLQEVREDAALSSSWTPLVFVFAAPLSASQVRFVDQALDLGRAGVSVLAVSDEADPVRTMRVDAERLVLPSGGQEVSPQLVEAPTRRTLVSLLSATGTPRTEPAPWWGDDTRTASSFPPSLSPRRSAAEVDPMPEPTVLLLGDVSLENASGSPPTRARMQCVEYCAWLLQHPGATAIQMQQGLLVAEGTRRSNMSRLRTWLGVAPDGQRYFPDAYSGHISLHPSVSSDWERFEALTSGGVNLASDTMLREALSLVRGAPLANVAFQWPWAEDLRTTMEGTIVDAACVLFDRSLTADDTSTAQWALRQGRLAAPADENLASREVQYWAYRGDRPKVDQAVLALTRSARAAGTDLHPATVTRIQQALHSFAGVPGRLHA